MQSLEVIRDENRYVPNILIVGSEGAAETALQELSFMFAGPTDIRVLPGPLLPLPRANCAVLILRNVESLTPEQQMELSQWLDSRPGVPVVSVNSSSVFPLVADGTFSDRLYYRLNMIVEDEITGVGTASWLVNSSGVNSSSVNR
jgi:sigma-54-interacting transcriptional regulator